jgi:class 3 adenylate cyclase
MLNSLPMTPRPSPEELHALGLYDPDSPEAGDQLRLLTGAFDLGGTLDEVTRAVKVRTNLGPLLLDLAMRPPGTTEDLSEFVTHQADPALVRRIWSALGLPDSAEPTIRVTPDAATALQFLTAASSLLGEEVTLGVARVIGSSMARLAETISSAFRVVVELPKLNRGQTYADVAEDYTSTVRDLLPPFLEAVDAVFRRQLVDVSYQMWSTDSDQVAVTFERVVCFADLVGSTEALHALSTRAMADMLRRFEELVWDLVGTAGGRVVKLIGDEAMFVLSDPALACRVGLDLIERSDRPVRIGMAYGTVVGLYGDYYGETVNLAARLVTVAEPSTLAVTDPIRLATSGGLTFDDLGPRSVKGFAEPVQAFRARRSEAEG